MDKLLKILAFLAVVFLPVACSDDDAENQSHENFDIKGKVFINSYFNEDVDIHEAGAEIIEFRTNDTVVQYNLFCLLVGDYIQMFDYQEKGRYGVVGNTVMIGLGDSLQTSVIYFDKGNPMLRSSDQTLYSYSDMTVAGLKKQFERLHTHDILEPLVIPADSLLKLEQGGRYLVRSESKSFVINIDSLSGSHAAKNQFVTFSVSGVPGQISITEETGDVYMMKFGNKAYMPVNKEIAEEEPEKIVFVLMCDGTTGDFTIASPSVADNFKGNKAITKFATLNGLTK